MGVAEIFDAVMEYEGEDVAALVQAEIDAGTAVKNVLQDGLIASLDVIGEKFSAGTLFVPEMEKAVATVQDANTNRNLNVKVMIGGPPVHHEFAMTIGADAYGMDAPAAVEQAREFLTG